MTNTPPKSLEPHPIRRPHDIKSTSHTLGLRNRSSPPAVNTAQLTRTTTSLDRAQSAETQLCLMQKTVKVRIGGRKWNKLVQKYFNYPQKVLVHDPRSSLRAGDVIEISSGWRVSKDVRHVVNRIIAPFGEPIEARPSVMTEVERLEERRLKKEAKALRRAKKMGTEEKIEESA
ncbi:hypothetical protein VE02_01591 [Pseudogymnoascus sp. 03VT05]|nr:hypothetical protein VE02_01591 [Pseudogymnoascus sp. 03VT05]